eukprot:765128-Hanusia_phi.AAC.2
MSRLSKTTFKLQQTIVEGPREEPACLLSDLQRHDIQPAEKSPDGAKNAEAKAEVDNSSIAEALPAVDKSRGPYLFHPNIATLEFGNDGRQDERGENCERHQQHSRHLEGSKDKRKESKA